MTIPIVPHVLHIGDSHHPWQAPPIERLTVHGDTPRGVRVQPGRLPGVTARPGQRQINRPHHLVYCVPDEATWTEVQRLHAAWQAGLDDFAAALRAQGRYCDRLAGAGADAPNPLTATVLWLYQAPDRHYQRSYVTTGAVPVVSRQTVTRHTPKMLVCANADMLAQTHCYLCPDDAAWQDVQARAATARQARVAWDLLLTRLGTYAQARADHRYATHQAQMVLV